MKEIRSFVLVVLASGFLVAAPAAAARPPHVKSHGKSAQHAAKHIAKAKEHAAKHAAREEKREARREAKESPGLMRNMGRFFGFGHSHEQRSKQDTKHQRGSQHRGRKSDG